MTNLNGQTLDILQKNIEKIKLMFPEVITEVIKGYREDKSAIIDYAVDFDKLKQTLGEYVDESKERYNFSWNGKGRALRLSQTPSLGTLRPCPEERKSWDTTENLYIEGDNLEVLKLLQKSYHNKIKMIYIDPPYNTGGDFVYPDDFSDSLENYKKITGQVDGEGNRISTNAEDSGRYHTDWLNMVYPRLRLARNLLANDGAIFISIDDNEVFNLKKICDEIFGEVRFVAQIPWRKRTAKSDVPYGISQDYEWILVYAKTEEFVACLEGGTRKYYETEDLPNRPWRIHDLTKQTSASERPNSYFTMVNPKTGDKYPANPNRTWAITEETFKKYYAENRIVFPGDYDFLSSSKPVFRYFKEDDIAKAGDKFGYIPVSTNLPDEIGMTQDGTKEIAEMFEQKIFGFPKPITLLKYLIKAVTATSKDKKDIIFDFFSGSATTAHAVMQLNSEDGGNRKFIMVQLPEVCDESSEAVKAGYKNICEIGKERIRRAANKIKEEARSTATNLDLGFRVFKLDTSNLKKWQPDYDNLEQTLMDSISNFVDRRSELDVVYEIVLKMGLNLTYPIEETVIGGKKVYSVGFGALMMCLDDDITTDVANGMVQLHSELQPETWKVVFKDNGFKSDSNKTNIKEILKCAGLEEDAFTTI